MSVDPVLFRGLERLLIVLVAGLCLWIAYRIGHGREASSGAVKWDSLSIELKKVGPSVFFGAFGTAIVVYALASPIETITRFAPDDNGAAAAERQTRYLTAQEQERSQRLLSDLSADMADLNDYVRGLENGTITPNERITLAAAIRRVVAQREDLLVVAFGNDMATRFENYLSRCAVAGASETAECARLREEIGPERLSAMQEFGVQ